MTAKPTKQKTEPLPTGTGTVKWFNPDKGYGFIAREGDKDLFVHIKDLERSEPKLTDLATDAEVTFSIDGDRNGRPKAVQVKLVSTEES